MTSSMKSGFSKPGKRWYRTSTSSAPMAHVEAKSIVHTGSGHFPGPRYGRHDSDLLGCVLTPDPAVSVSECAKASLDFDFLAKDSLGHGPVSRLR